MTPASNRSVLIQLLKWKIPRFIQDKKGKWSKTKTKGKEDKKCSYFRQLPDREGGWSRQIKCIMG